MTAKQTNELPNRLKLVNPIRVAPFGSAAPTSTSNSLPVRSTSDPVAQNQEEAFMDYDAEATDTAPASTPRELIPPVPGAFIRVSNKEESRGCRYWIVDSEKYGMRFFQWIDKPKTPLESKLEEIYRMLKEQDAMIASILQISKGLNEANKRV